MSAPPGPIPFARRRALLGRYAIWQSRDFVMNVFIVSLVLFGLIGWLFHMQISTIEETMAMSGKSMPLAVKLTLFNQLLPMFATVAPIIAVSGVISSDRAAGFTRFLFSKPVSPITFYAQSLLVRFAGFLALGCALLFGWSRLHPPGLDWKFVADLTICFVSVGGIVFLASAISRFDGLIAIMFLLTSVLLWEKWEHASGIRHWLTWLVPPLTKLGNIHDWYLGVNGVGSLAEIPFPTEWALWNVGYGLACLLLGFVMLRRIPLTKA